MGRIRGFLLKHRVASIFRRRRCPSVWRSPLWRLMRWSQRMRAKAKAIVCGGGSHMGYIEVGEEVYNTNNIPRGKMAVYVGQRDGEMERIIVPIVYINHPLFLDLLNHSQMEFGFNHPGGITIPCRISDFERVRTRIKAARSTRKLLPWKL